MTNVYGPVLHASFMATGITSFAAILAADVSEQWRKH